MNQQLLLTIYGIRQLHLNNWEQLCGNTPCVFNDTDLITCNCCLFGQVSNTERKVYGGSTRYMHLLEDTIEVIWTDN